MAAWSKEVFASNLLRYMEKFDKNQKEIAEIAGVSAPTVNDWVKAKKYPRIDKIEILANYFHILKSDLIEEKTEAERQGIIKNDIIADVTDRLLMDDDFMAVVEIIYSIEDAERLKGIKQMLTAFLK